MRGFESVQFKLRFKQEPEILYIGTYRARVSFEDSPLALMQIEKMTTEKAKGCE